jgi:deazaflavin-dependent oxidoreductase (nitroreductase family)
VVKVLLIALGAVALLYLLVVPLIERVVPRRVLVGYWRVMNPRWMPTAGLFPGFAVIETTGHRTGKLHQVPVGGRLRADTFWFIAANGRQAHFVRNIEADPRVRVKVHGRWRQGTARLCPDDNVWKRLVRLNPLNSIFIRISGRELLTVRVDLDRSGASNS